MNAKAWELSTLLLLLVATASGAQRSKFPLKCDPFPEGTSERHKIDRVCRPTGVMDPEVQPDLRDAKKMQGEIKNNLCAASNETTPQTVTLDTILDLQRRVEALHVDFGGTHGHEQKLPKNRDVLKDPMNTGLGEGSYVQFVGYLIDPHYSPARETTAGESVNCHQFGHDFADIHMSLSEKKASTADLETAEKQQLLCGMGSAEIIPHFRPEIFEKQNLDELQNKIVRIRGQLMFDAEHRPCTKAAGQSEWKPQSPPRISLWEIHPVYTIDVCNSKSMQKCRAGTDSDWTDLESWLDENAQSDNQ